MNLILSITYVDNIFLFRSGNREVIDYKLAAPSHQSCLRLIRAWLHGKRMLMGRENRCCPRGEPLVWALQLSFASWDFSWTWIWTVSCIASACSIPSWHRSSFYFLAKNTVNFQVFDCDLVWIKGVGYLQVKLVKTLPANWPFACPGHPLRLPDPARQAAGAQTGGPQHQPGGGRDGSSWLHLLLPMHTPAP